MFRTAAATPRRKGHRRRLIFLCSACFMCRALHETHRDANTCCGDGRITPHRRDYPQPAEKLVTDDDDWKRVDPKTLRVYDGQ